MTTIDAIDYDLEKTCRMCLYSNNMSNQEMIKIFEPCSSKITVDGELKLLKFKISPSDGLPQQICTDCMNCLININKFRVIGLESQTVLERYFKDNLVNALRVPSQPHQQQLMTDEIVWIKSEVDDVDKLNQLLPSNEKQYDDYNDYTDLLQTYDSDNEMVLENDFEKTDIVVNAEKHLKSNDLKLCNAKELKCLCKYCLKHCINIELKDYQQQQPTDECKLDPINEIKCLHCYLNCKNIEDFVKHTNAVHPGLLCWICKEFYLDKTELIIHWNSQHENANDDLKCNVCDAVFDNIGNLESHKRNTHSSTEHVCDNQNKLKHHKNDHYLNTEKKFNCNFCDKSFLNSHRLKNHEKTHEKPGRYKCSICGQRFADVIKFSDHRKRLHKDEFKMLQCDYCDKEYLDRSSLGKHIKRHHKNSSLEVIHCDECNSSFATRYRYEIHKNAHQKCTGIQKSEINNEIDPSEQTSKWLCKFCGKHYVIGKKTDYQHPIDKCNLEKEPNCRHCVETFNNIDDYIKHVNTKHSPGYTCSICNMNCFDKPTLTIHLATHTAEECVIKCDECNRGFKKRRYLLKHKSRMHIISEHVCDICSIKFDTYEKFKAHMKRHTWIKQKCSHCDRTFNQSSRLIQHERTHSGELTHLCNICGIGFMNPTTLSSHMKQHEDLSLNSNKYQCKFCDKVYTVYSSWYHHQHFYHAEKIFRCDKCDRNFITTKSFKCHMKSHDDVERKHKCQECSLAFKRNAHLQNHIMSVHLKKKPFKCLSCDKAFAKKSDLNIHVRVHSGDKPHSCNYCNESFRLRIDKRSHERTAHTDEKNRNK